MEEKERYELFGEYIIKDNDNNAKCQLLDTYKTYIILNQQDKRIKELEQQLSKDFTLGEYIRLEQENQQLKQQLLTFAHRISEQNKEILKLHDFPKKIMEEIRKNAHLQSFDYGERYCEEEGTDEWAIDLYDLEEILDAILKKYGGGNE